MPAVKKPACLNCCPVNSAFDCTKNATGMTNRFGISWAKRTTKTRKNPFGFEQDSSQEGSGQIGFVHKVFHLSLYSELERDSVVDSSISRVICARRAPRTLLSAGGGGHDRLHIRGTADLTGHLVWRWFGLMVSQQCGMPSSGVESNCNTRWASGSRTMSPMPSHFCSPIPADGLLGRFLVVDGGYTAH